MVQVWTVSQFALVQKNKFCGNVSISVSHSSKRNSVFRISKHFNIYKLMKSHYVVWFYWVLCVHWTRLLTPF